MSILQLLAEQMTAPEEATEPAPLYRMFIRDLVLLCRIGVYLHEKLRPQRVRIGVDLSIARGEEPHNDDIANVLSYDDILEGIKRLAGAGHINLVETLGESIADICLADPRVIDARVTIEKLDIEPNASVGIEIERRRRRTFQHFPYALPHPWSIWDETKLDRKPVG
jgi:7,8-dihydroneopterin aldolase/epimerase/oxygenase